MELEGPQLLATYKPQDLTVIAMSVFDALDTMHPMAVPELPTLSFDAEAIIKAKTPSKKIPDKHAFELEQYFNLRKQRAQAKGENQRRIRTLLWAEQYLRERGDERHEVLRAFNRDCWQIIYPAPVCFALREEQVSDVA